MDLISRKAAIDACIEVSKQEEEHSKMWATGLRYAKKILTELPSVPAVPLDAIDAVPVKHGHWEKPEPDGVVIFDERAYAQCSECKKKSYLGWTDKYCRYCGAKMDLE